jgi:DNA-binding GntR family transcriptional regulator
VTELSPDELREIYTLRSVLEGMATRLLVERITDEELGLLTEIVEEMKQAADQGDVERLVELDLAFHERIWQLSGHKRLCETMRQMIGPIRLFLAVNTQVYGDLVDNVLEHVDLVEVMASRDARQAERVMVEHIEEAGERNLAYLETMRQRQKQERASG